MNTVDFFSFPYPQMLSKLYLLNVEYGNIIPNEEYKLNFKNWMTQMVPKNIS